MAHEVRRLANLAEIGDRRCQIECCRLSLERFAGAAQLESGQNLLLYDAGLAQLAELASRSRAPGHCCQGGCIIATKRPCAARYDVFQ